MAYEPEDRDAAVIGRDDLQFEGEDVDFPTSPDQYDDKSPTAKHTDFDLSKGTQTVDGVKFDVGSIFKGIPDSVTSTAKAVAEVSKAKAASAESTKKDESIPKAGSSSQPSSSPPAPIVKPATSSGGTYLVFGAGILAAVALVAVLNGSKRKRRTL